MSDMTISTEDGLITDIAALRDSGGSQLGRTDWQETTPARIDSIRGCNRGSQFHPWTRRRGKGEIVEATEFPGGLQVKLRLTLEVEGSEKPAVVADRLIRVSA
jgi:hypothetical protein